MLSYHSDPALKARYLARVEGHADADEIIKGRYWEAGKGCAVGCTIHGDSHLDFEHELGIPQVLAWLEDVIFEGLPNRLAKTWPERFLSSIAPGKELSGISWQLLLWLLTEDPNEGLDHPVVGDAIRYCADLLNAAVNGRPVDQPTAERAATMAWAAAKQAEAVAATPVRARWIAESAAQAAESLALSTTCAASSAERAATAVSAAIARSADYVRVSEKLLELLSTAR